MTVNSARSEQESWPFRLYTDAWGQLVYADGSDQEHVGVELIRAFPISHPQGSISICGAEGREVLWIDELSALPAGLRRQVEEQLAQREFLPIIQRVLHISRATEPSLWEVDTDRGRTSFHVNHESDVRSLEGRRALVTDVHGLRYLIADRRALDRHSQQLLERYL